MPSPKTNHYQGLESNFPDLAEILKTNDKEMLQERAAPVLRQMAINHLAKSKKPVACGFRGESVATHLNEYRDFLKKQSVPGVWGTYIEATALGEIFDYHVVVIPVKNGQEQKPLCLYRGSDDNAPTVILYNSNNTHWFVNAKTLGDGNCLYNAFAQTLKNIHKPERSQTPATLTNPVTFFKLPESEVVQSQRRILEAIKKQPTPQKLEENLTQEEERMRNLPENEQNQIKQDHQLALTLAREEMVATKSSHP